MKKIFILSLLLVPLVSQAQQVELHKQADAQITSGEVTWTMLYEVFQPAAQIPQENKMPGVSEDKFQSWKTKQTGYRQQTFTVQATFQGEYLLFYSFSEAGDILPMTCDRLIAFNGVSSTFIDNTVKIMMRTAETKRYREGHYSVFYISPRACGFDYLETFNLVRKVKDNKNNLPVPSVEDDVLEKKINIKGSYPENGTTILAQLFSDDTHPQVFKEAKFISPIANERVRIRNSNMVKYDGIIFPSKTVITRKLDGKVEDMTDATEYTGLLDRITLTVQQAGFNKVYPNDIFNPALPEGYQDLTNSQ